MNNKYLICDSCAAEFQIEADDIKEVNLSFDDVDLRVIYFCCPECKKVYIIQVLDDEAFDLQKGYFKVRDDCKIRPSVYPIMLAKRKRLEEHIKMLKSVYGGKIIQYLANQE